MACVLGGDACAGRSTPGTPPTAASRALHLHHGSHAQHLLEDGEVSCALAPGEPAGLPQQAAGALRQLAVSAAAVRITLVAGRRSPQAPGVERREARVGGVRADAVGRRRR